MLQLHCWGHKRKFKQMTVRIPQKAQVETSISCMYNTIKTGRFNQNTINS